MCPDGSARVGGGSGALSTWSMEWDGFEKEGADCSVKVSVKVRGSTL